MATVGYGYRNKNRVRIPVYVTMAVDPATSSSERADFTGITVVGCAPDGSWYVMEADAFKGRPDQVIERLVRHAQNYRPQVLSLEAVAAQILFRPLLVPRLREAGCHPDIYEYHPPTRRTKAQRIEALQPLFKQGKIFIREGLRDLLDQLDHFPELDHDDLLDSLAQHLELVRPAREGEIHPEISRDWFQDWEEWDLGPKVEERVRTDGTRTGRSYTRIRRPEVRTSSGIS